VLSTRAIMVANLSNFGKKIKYLLRSCIPGRRATGSRRGSCNAIINYPARVKNLTEGPISRHLLAMALPIVFGMLLQTLYYVVDLYFVARLGDAAIAGVGAAGNVMFLIFALTQTLGVGAVALISHATGRQDRADANYVFNQSVAMSALCAIITLVAGFGLAGPYMRALASDLATVAAGLSYLYWFLPGLALQFALVVMGSALRGTGIVKPTMIVQVATVLLNIVLAPVLIAGWGTGHPLGVAGAALASTVSIAVGVVLLSVYFLQLEKYVAFDLAQWRPHWATWRRMLNVGVPVGGEFGLIAVYTGLIYWIIKDFGAPAQAAFGIGSRIMQSIFLPAMAVAFASAPIAGQNFGARKPDRVRETFRVTALWSCGLMMALTVLCQWQGAAFVRFFTGDAEVIRLGSEFLRIVSWNFVAMGIVFTCSSLFQALGNTWPALLSTTARLPLFALPSLWLMRQPGFELRQVWYVSVATVLVQGLFSYALLRWQMRERLGALAAGVGSAPAAT
jgi:putative MATE family efflux protein